jgi:hypothetical protein
MQDFGGLNISSIQDNLLLSYDLTKVSDIREVDYLYMSKFISSLTSDELTTLWVHSITNDYPSDLDLVLFLCQWLMPRLENLEWYEYCISVQRTMRDASLYLQNFP